MYLHRILLLCALGSAALVQAGCEHNCQPGVPNGEPHSCPIAGLTPGTSQAACRSGGIGTTSCDDHLVCIDGACIPCGAPGMTCCAPLGHYTCDTEACDNTMDVPYPTCPGGATCGVIGNACCDGPEGSCPISGVCSPSDGVCHDPAGSNSACAGGPTHTAAILDEFGCVQGGPLTFTSGGSDPLTCGKDALALQDPGGKYHLGPVDQAPTCHDLCGTPTDGINPPSTYHACYFDADATTCKTSLSGNSSWAEGACMP